MKTVAIANASGGRGKTAVTKMLASLLTGLHHKRVLIIDLDFLVGSNISSFFLPPDQIRHSTRTILEALADPDASPHIIEAHVSLFVGNDTLRQADEWFARQANPDGVLRAFIQSWNQSAHFDLCLIDCRPRPSALTRAALVAADCVLVPIWVRRFGTDFDVAESNVASTFDEVRTLKAQQSLATEDVGFSIPKPLAAMDDEDWKSLVEHLITRLET